MSNYHWPGMVSLLNLAANFL